MSSETSRAKRWLIVATIVVFLQFVGVGFYLWFQSRRAPVVIASYRADFQSETPKVGWRYLWNASGEIGNAANYTSLAWYGTGYNLDGDAQMPRPRPAKYLRLDPSSGHPGQGKSQEGGVGNDIDRYVIAAFTVQVAGTYFLINSAIGRNDGPLKGDVVVRVFVNNSEIGPWLHCNSKEAVSFDRSLNKLRAGDTIYVAIGPDDSDYNDNFALDFAIVGPAIKPR